MSHWASGKLDLKCSIDVLKRALINIMPEWQKHIVTDPSGSIKIYDYLGAEMKGKTYHLMIPGTGNPNKSGAPGLKYNDIGLRREEDGTWTVDVDESGLTKIKNLKGNLAGEVARMKAKAIAILRGYKVISDKSDEEKSETILECDVGMFQAMSGAKGKEKA